ncbi:MAG: capsular biosynthesis protein [Bacteroidetes bacterium]|nr:capsular biosynthesis protein [Bacteroidota bacterium]
MSFLSSIFGKKRPDADLSVLRTDVHSHLIPGIDDGSVSVENSMELIHGLYDLGYRKLITTPHIMSDFYRNTPEVILRGLDDVRAAISAEGLDIEIEAAAEYYCDHDFELKIGKEELLTFGNRYLLFELSYLNISENFDSVTFKLQLEGYKPVLAHPERYPYWYQSFDKYSEIRDKGVLLQINIASLAGHYGTVARRIAERLVENNMVDLLGSDMHKTSHIEVYRRAIQQQSMRDLIASGQLLNATL